MNTKANERAMVGGRIVTHREHFPEQYTHRLCGHRVRVPADATIEPFTVERVVRSARFGELVPIPGRKDLYAVSIRSVEILD